MNAMRIYCLHIPRVRNIDPENGGRTFLLGADMHLPDRNASQHRGTHCLEYLEDHVLLVIFFLNLKYSKSRKVISSKFHLYIIDWPHVSILFLSSPLPVRISHVCPSAFPLELYFVNTHFYFSSLLLINSVRRHFAGHSPYCYQRSCTVPCCRLLETIYTERNRLEISSNSYERFSVYPNITCTFK